MGFELTTDQVHAVYDIENWWVHSKSQTYELVGRSGSGKSSVIKYFIDRIGIAPYEVAYICYMGKAAMVLARKGLHAQTIHSLIYTYEKVLDLDENGKIQVMDNGRPKMKFQFTKVDKLPKHIKLLVIDEAGMVSEEIAKDILSFGKPVIALGDLNQLPPVFGSPFFLKEPNYELHKIMRQAENDPIVYLANLILNGERLPFGVYGKSSVLPKNQLSDYQLKNTDVVLTSTNKLRHEINTLYREKIMDIKKLEYPQVGEKVICIRNNWSRSIDNAIYLMNGMTGYIDYIDSASFIGGKFVMDFRPDFLKKTYKNLTVDYDRLFSDPTKEETKQDAMFNRNDMFEFGYAISVHKSQGSEWKNVTYLREPKSWNKEMLKKIDYTAITRAEESITIYQ